MEILAAAPALRAWQKMHACPAAAGRAGIFWVN